MYVHIQVYANVCILLCHMYVYEVFEKSPKLLAKQKASARNV